MDYEVASYYTYQQQLLVHYSSVAAQHRHISQADPESIKHKHTAFPMMKHLISLLMTANYRLFCALYI